MKWNFQIVEAQHYCETDVTKQLCYLDKKSSVLVPMLDEILTPKYILGMEEWSTKDEGFIFMDSKTHKVGLLIRH